MRNVLFSIAYVGNTSHHMANIELPNQARPGPGPFTPRQIWPTFGTLYYQDYNSNANPNGLQLKAQKTFTSGFSFLASFTWSKTIDDSGGTSSARAPAASFSRTFFDRGADRGLAAQDARHRLVVSYV
jgi:hypothetical protein